METSTVKREDHGEWVKDIFRMTSSLQGETPSKIFKFLRGHSTTNQTSIVEHGVQRSYISFLSLVLDKYLQCN